MWLDAFIKPSIRDDQKLRVARVDGVETPSKPNEYKGLEKTTRENNGVSMRVDGVEPIKRPTRPTPTDTATILRCLYGETPRKPNEYKGLANQSTRPTRPTREKHDAQEIADTSKELLKQFRFDLIQQEIANGHPAEELHRVNNMAWEFMQADGMAFEAAIQLAGEIVAHGQTAACEAAYADVMALFERIKGA